MLNHPLTIPQIKTRLRIDRLADGNNKELKSRKCQFGH